ncbi:endonuclease [Mycobacterium deserti]|uniref:Endonuclease n=1 Tax=Mycobacterium deserti TaxID=2978347 RepID=A0ABT2MI34_9MYCO|nr:endonuclease [Mycobacterium deserti]MCT7661943.1 endonuclease [Mycobacterium deserti]
MDTAARKKVDDLLEQAGVSYAEEAGIRLADTPKPLFQLLTFCMLASKPIDASIAVAAARELFSAGMRTPDAVRNAARTDMIRAFGRAHYVRYDESSATRLVDIAQAVSDSYDGDLRKLAESSGHDITAATRLLKQFTGIGDTGAAIFLREVQDTWTWVRPYFDTRAMTGARAMGLPADVEALSELAPRRNANLAAALVRVSLDDGLREKLSSAQ